MKKRKRILSLLVTFCTLFTLLGIPPERGIVCRT